MSYLIESFYKFVPLPDYVLMKEPLLQSMRILDIKGTIILASEGINGSFCGVETSVPSLIQHLKQYPGLDDLTFCETFNEVNPFEKAKVKLRKEIVTLGEADVFPWDATGEHLGPEEWNALLADPDVVLIDTRNEYEVSLGTFKGAIDPGTDNFRDFPEFVQKKLADKKDKKIAMFCTGGIRCEKSTTYLKKLGFDNVYQLHGGILNYLNQIPQEHSLWEGSCFVFDERIALDMDLRSLPKGTIDSEWKHKNRNRNPNNLENASS